MRRDAFFTVRTRYGCLSKYPWSCRNDDITILLRGLEEAEVRMLAEPCCREHLKMDA